MDASPEGCTVVVSPCQTSYRLPVKRRLQFTCPSCVLSPFPLCQHCLMALYVSLRPLNQREVNLATKGVFSRDFYLPSLQRSGKHLCWSKEVNRYVLQVAVTEEGHNVPYLSRECHGTSPLTDCLRRSAKLYVK